jgi:hypothetical protein
MTWPGGTGEDEFFWKILDELVHFKNFSVVGNCGKELVVMKEEGRELLCIPNVTIGGRKA